ncbi:PDZ domain-containing protein [Sediminibacterium roseum]|uniref:PDZ domain-containing protein n=1 Tax=Sediminibacterium roseum TaxID=1978412 RepID=A0ABW9ZRF4_9BACT|nr:PDZ domain-containing protein [Sediminibacterium roseum]NCI48628.1 PDZ domain-containing protein [Sediminibacterium roseum]
MNTKILPLIALALGVAVLGNAQSKDKSDKKEKAGSDVIIRKKGDSKEKMTIVIDGNDITVNGKPLNELKDGDVEVLSEKGMGAMIPRLRGKMGTMGGLKMFGGVVENNRAYLGVTSTASEKGAQVATVQKGSPAEKAGFKKDDVITKVNDIKISNGGDLYDAIGEFKPGEKVTITYLRDGKENTATVALEKSTISSSFSFDRKDLDHLKDLGDLKGMEGLHFDMPQLHNIPGLNGREFSFNRRPRLGVEIQDVEEGKGVKILDVDDETPAAKAGLKKDDVISELNGKAIGSVDELQSALKEIKEGDTFKLGYKRNGQLQTAEIRFPKKLKTAEL